MNSRLIALPWLLLLVGYGCSSKRLLNGAYRSYYPNGQIEFEMAFEDGRSDGTATHWYDNGRKSSETRFRTENGCRHERGYRTWDRSGQIILQIDHEVARPFRRQWDHDGRQIAEGYYKGEEAWEGTFVAGTNANGIYMIETYADGELVGTYPDPKYADCRALEFPFEDGSDEAPFVTIFKSNHWTADTVLVAAWPGGRIVWSQDAEEGGPPYFAGCVGTDVMASFLERFATKRYLRQDEVPKHGAFIVDGDYYVISLQHDGYGFSLSSGHDLYNLDIDDDFRRVWKELRDAVFRLIPSGGKELEPFRWELRHAYVPLSVEDKGKPNKAASADAEDAAADP